jgi:predicted carbohydrate-binding protein with CBM5 and CBM33 domain
MPTSPFPPDNNAHEGACSGDWTLGMISDEVVVPKDISPGQYVVSWRWDCEETAQVWASCGDVNIVA